jgi:hypothetical protein
MKLQDQSRKHNVAQRADARAISSEIRTKVLENRLIKLLDWRRVDEFNKLRSGVRVDTCSSRPFSLTVSVLKAQY